MVITELNSRYGIADQLVFSQHPSGLIVGNIKTQYCAGQFFLLGAHVSAFQPTSQAHPVLFMSADSWFAEGKPIRGGVPICFPWFGTNKLDPQAPGHGIARLANWSVEKTAVQQDAVLVQLGITLGALKLEYVVSFGNLLDMELRITNVSASTQTCEAALHTYFQISEASAVKIRGLESLAYIDALTQKTVEASAAPITFTAETDRVYHGEVGKIVIEDPDWGRRLVLRPRNSRTTVVWNPWIAKSQRMPDFGDLEYHHMCCVETANVGPNQIVLPAAQTQLLAVSIAAE